MAIYAEVVVIRKPRYPWRTTKQQPAPPKQNNARLAHQDYPNKITGQDLPGQLNAALDLIKIRLGHSMDLIIRPFNLANTKAALVCLKGLVSKKQIDQHILQPLLQQTSPIEQQIQAPENNNLLTLIKDNIISSLECQKIATLDATLNKIISGYTALLVDGQTAALVMDTADFSSRDVTEPETEAVVRGPREGFTEKIQVNTSLLRRKIKSPQLRLDKITLGQLTKTDLCLAYIENIVNPKIVEETKKRLARIDIDGILESGYIESFIQDAPFSIFATIGNTEKPDIAAAKMLEGRVVILVDGTPMALILPYLFIETIQASEDYYSNFYSASMMRWLRLTSLIITTILPALYVATTAFNPEVLPTIFMITMAATREGVPMPAAAEMLFLGLVFEILREAGVRQPRPVGQAVSIIGALVIGQAAISSGLVSAPAVMVTVLTGITSFAIPAQSVAYVYIRFFWLLLASILGFFGLVLGIIVVITHLIALRSFGVPYLSPLAPANYQNWKDLFIRVPLWALPFRPSSISKQNTRKMGHLFMPKPPAPKRHNPTSNPRGDGDYA